jgi:hypothetical protein
MQPVREGSGWPTGKDQPGPDRRRQEGESGFRAPHAIPLSTCGIAASLALYVVLVVLAMAGYSPALRHQVALAEAGRVGNDLVSSGARRGAIINARCARCDHRLLW